jgi:hypothetical protein
MANTLKFGNGQWATKEGSTLAFNDEGGNFKPLPFNFTRSTSATRVNKQGLIEVVTNNKPRIDFLNDSNGALLLEPQRTNIITYSEELSNWSNIQNVTVTDNQIISPDGTLNASKINETVNNSVHRLFLNPTVASAKHTYSVFVKKGTRSWIYLRLDGASSEQRTWFDVENGVIGTINSDHIASIENFGNGWYRCAVSIKGTTYDTTPLAILAITKGNDVQDYAGDVNEYIYAWGAQLEEGSYATSYIPTQGAISTKVDEVCSDAGNNQVINSIEGVLYWNIITQDKNSSSKAISINNGINTILSIYFYSSSINVVFNVNGVNQFYANFGLTIGQEYKIAVLYQENNFALYVNGVKRAEDTNGSVPSVDTFDRLNLSEVSGGKFYGNVKEVKLYNTALTDQELINLTTI